MAIVISHRANISVSIHHQDQHVWQWKMCKGEHIGYTCLFYLLWIVILTDSTLPVAHPSLQIWKTWHWVMFFLFGGYFLAFAWTPTMGLILENGTTSTLAFARTTTWGLILANATMSILAYLQKMRNTIMVMFLIFVPGNGRGEQEQGWGQWANIQGMPAIIYIVFLIYWLTSTLSLTLW